MLHTTLFLVLTFVVSINDSAADSDIANIFIITYDKNCKDDRSVVTALLENNIFSKEEAADFESELNSLVKQTREERLGMSIVNEEIHPRRRLSDMDWQDRRDQSISILNFIRNNGSKTQRRLRASSQKSSVLYKHLKHLGMDVINDDSDHIFEIARTLPCLAHPPEKNKAAYPAQLPNDFNSGRQWYLASPETWYKSSVEKRYFTAAPPLGIGATDAWKCQNGQRNGPVVAVFDTGCSAHPDLERNICSNKEDCFGFDAVDELNPYHEERSHGTAMAGFIAAVGNNNFGLTGVCWGCKIMCIKVGTAKEDMQTYTTVIGINYVLSKKNIVRITNHSYGGYLSSFVEESAFRELREAGILVVTSAGNNNYNIEQPHSDDSSGRLNLVTNRTGDPSYPSCYEFDNIITVGASRRNGQKADSSNYGKTQVDLFAPGEDLEGLCNINIDNCFTKLHSGTSCSAALVSGAAALLLAQDPTMTYKEVKDILMETVRKVPDLEPYCVTGGILNLAAAMERVKERKSCSTPSFDLIPTPEKDRTVEFNGYNFCNNVVCKIQLLHLIANFFNIQIMKIRDWFGDALI